MSFVQKAKGSALFLSILNIFWLVLKNAKSCFFIVLCDCKRND
ncbi:hypothetical protein BSM4216_1731 [Bacillus smithii]|nr:hypothetical protein BSM4216_1731 [Bacillus smithii]